MKKKPNEWGKVVKNETLFHSQPLLPKKIYLIQKNVINQFERMK